MKKLRRHPHKSKNPWANIIKKNLYRLAKDMPDKEVFKKLNERKVVFSSFHSYLNLFSRPTVGFHMISKLMIATGKKEFTIILSDEDIEEIKRMEIEENEKENASSLKVEK